MKGFILAAGFGQRMLPVTEHIPKPLLPVGNVPLIVYSIKFLAYHGIVDIAINLHYLGRQIREALGDGSQYGVHLTYSEEPEILGTGGALKRMHGFLDETFVVVNSDTLIDLDLHAVVSEHQQRQALATMVLRDTPAGEDFGQIEIDAHSGRIERILGQGGVPSIPVVSQMFTGVQVLEPKFLEYIPPDIHTCIIRYGYAKALSNNEPLYGTCTKDFWADAGTPTRYWHVNAEAMAQTLKLRHIDPLAGYALTPKKDVAQAVRMGQNVDLGAASQLRAPVLLGNGTRIGERAQIGPECICGANVHIGKDAVVSSSILLDGAQIEPGEQIKHTLVSKKSRLNLAPVSLKSQAS